MLSADKIYTTDWMKTDVFFLGYHITGCKADQQSLNLRRSIRQGVLAAEWEEDQQEEDDGETWGEKPHLQ